LAGGKALTPTTKAGIWNVEAADGTNINVRNFSTSGVGRWTVDFQNTASFRPLVNRDRVEIKFK